MRRKIVEIFVTFLKFFSINATILIIVVFIGYKSKRTINTSNYSMYFFLIMILILSPILETRRHQGVTLKLNKNSLGNENVLQDIKDLLSEERWKIEIENNNKIIFRSPLLRTIWVERIVIETENESITIHGPRLYINLIENLAQDKIHSATVNP